MGQRIPVTLGNITPLSVKPFQPGRLALVCEGGGQRGIFTAGVLDEFMRAGFNPFDMLFGTSAGAQNLSAYLCNQPGYARKVITRYTTAREFFDPMRFVRGGNLIDLDWLVDSTAKKMPLAMAYAEDRFAQGKEFWMCACRGDDYTPNYFSPTQQTWLDLIRASSAIPVLPQRRYAGWRELSGRRRQRCDPGAGGRPSGRANNRSDPHRAFADVLHPAVV